MEAKNCQGLVQYVGYIRVSTQKQGVSGLGLEGQIASLKNYNTVAFFKEIESGKNNDRPELKKAIAKCREIGGTLLVAKIDRLSRNVAFTLNLIDSGVKVCFADMPNIDIISLATLSAVAQKEAETISQRIKAALQARKARGLSNDRSGNIRKRDKAKGGRHSGKVRRERGKEKTLKAYQMFLTLKSKHTAKEIVELFNVWGMRTVRGCSYTVSSLNKLKYKHKKK